MQTPYTPAMLVGPLFSRELLTASRSWRHYALRSGYVLLLFVLIYTAGQVIFGFQQVRLAGDVARFGQFVFGLLAITQLLLVMMLALLLATSTVSTEKDRRTLILLLMTDLRGRELVVGKMLASLVGLVTVIAVSAPVFGLLRLLGGVTLSQILWLEAVCLAAGLLVAAWSTLVAYWREKTFQTLAIATLGVASYLIATAAVAAIASGPVGYVARLLSPLTAVTLVLDPLRDGGRVDTAGLAGSIALLVTIASGLLAFTCARVRVWNPSRVLHVRTDETVAETAGGRRRSIWDRPVLWREIKTRAYGGRVFVIKGVFLLLAAAAYWYALTTPLIGQPLLGPFGLAFVGLGLGSLVLANAQAVTSVTTERDGQTLELLLATEVPVSEFVWSKALGTLWNTKELLLAPLGLVIVAAARGLIEGETLVFMTIGFLVLVAFSIVLGLHFALNYRQSRQAIAGSLGTLLFLFLGIFVCMLLIVEGRSSFALQFAPFIVFILGGAIALWTALTHRQPSSALTVASLLLPFSTFYAITGFLLGDTLAVAVAVSVAYGFATVAMLIPALSDNEFAVEAVRA